MKMLLVPILLGCVSCAASPPSPGPGRPSGPQQLLSGVFLSPMGEPFRASETAGPELLSRWFAGADLNGDGFLRLPEMEADAGRFFATLDVDRDGEIEPDEMTRYETEIAPEVQLGRRMGPGFGGGGVGPPGRGARPGGRPGAPGGGGGGPPRSFGGRSGGPPGGRRAPFALLDFPQPVIAADADLNRGVSGDEFRRAAGQRFLRLDRNGDGALTLEELRPPPDRQRRRRRGAAL